MNSSSSTNRQQRSQPQQSGVMPKEGKSKKQSGSTRHEPLTTTLTTDPGYLKAPKAVKIAKQSNESVQERKSIAAMNRIGRGNGSSSSATDMQMDDGNDEQFVDADISAKILRAVQKQQSIEATIADDDERNHADDHGDASVPRRRKQSVSMNNRLQVDDNSDDESDFEDDEFSDSEENDIDLTAEDEAALNMFLPTTASTSASGTHRTLADLIMDKINEKQNGISSSSSDSNSNLTAAETIAQRVDPKVRDVYSQVGVYLSHYTSGKIPKAFKIIPALRNWEEIIFITAPESWSAQAVYIATKLFASNLNPKMAQRFFALVLLPRVKENISKYKRLNFHLYQALKKALYKPASFFKGILLPLAEEADAREAVIVSSVLAKCSIPVLHSAVAVLKLCEMDYSGACELFIKTLVNKKYSLPYRVLDALVQHYSDYSSDERQMPVIWHQALLVFVQRYKHELTLTQRKRLRELTKVQVHHGITPEIRRELVAVKAMDATAKHLSHLVSQASVATAAMRDDY